MLSNEVIKALQEVEAESDGIKITYFAPSQNEVGVITPESCGEEIEIYLHGKTCYDKIRNFREQLGLDLL
jgi:hypothetical protein